MASMPASAANLASSAVRIPLTAMGKRVILEQDYTKLDKYVF